MLIIKGLIAEYNECNIWNEVYFKILMIGKAAVVEYDCN